MDSRVVFRIHRPCLVPAIRAEQRGGPESEASGLHSRASTGGSSGGGGGVTGRAVSSATGRLRLFRAVPARRIRNRWRSTVHVAELKGLGQVSYASTHHDRFLSNCESNLRFLIVKADGSAASPAGGVQDRTGIVYGQRCIGNSQRRPCRPDIFKLPSALLKCSMPQRSSARRSTAFIGTESHEITQAGNLSGKIVDHWVQLSTFEFLRIT